MENILSLFDGISGAMIALRNSGIIPKNYFASEINQKAISISQHNFPEIIQVGDVRNLSSEMIPVRIDLLIAGSPCQGFSVNGRQLNFEDERSKLLFEFLRLRDELKPKYWLLENVATMKPEIKSCIDELLGVEGEIINSSTVSAQNRNRIYWTNLKNEDGFGDIFKTKSQKVLDVLEPEPGVDLNLSLEKINSQYFSPSITDGVITLNPKFKNGKQTYQQDRIYMASGRFPALTSSLGNRFNILDNKGRFRKLSVREQARLQGIPDAYRFDSVSDLSASEAIGNGFTIGIIEGLIRRKNLNSVN